MPNLCAGRNVALHCFDARCSPCQPKATLIVAFQFPSPTSATRLTRCSHFFSPTPPSASPTSQPARRAAAAGSFRGRRAPRRGQGHAGRPPGRCVQGARGRPRGGLAGAAPRHVSRAHARRAGRGGRGAAGAAAAAAGAANGAGGPGPCGQGAGWSWGAPWDAPKCDQASMP